MLSSSYVFGSQPKLSYIFMVLQGDIKTHIELDPSPHFLLFLNNQDNHNKLRYLFNETLNKGKTKQKIHTHSLNFKLERSLKRVHFKVSSIYREQRPREAKSSV